MVKKNTTSKTKADLMKENNQLKDKIRELLSGSKVVGKDLDKRAIGIVEVDGNFKLAILNYSEETKEAVVSDIKDTGYSKDREMALYYAKKFLVEEVFNDLFK